MGIRLDESLTYYNNARSCEWDFGSKLACNNIKIYWRSEELSLSSRNGQGYIQANGSHVAWKGQPKT